MQVPESPLKFTQPQLVKTTFAINPTVPPQEGAVVDCELFVGIGKNSSDNSSAAVPVALRVALNKGKEDKSAFTLEVVMQAFFSVPPEAQDEMKYIYLNQSAPALLLSYARPIIASLTNAAGIPTVNLPFMNFTGAKEQVKSNH